MEGSLEYFSCLPLRNRRQKRKTRGSPANHVISISPSQCCKVTAPERVGARKSPAGCRTKQLADPGRRLEHRATAPLTRLTRAPHSCRLREVSACGGKERGRAQAASRSAKGIQRRRAHSLEAMLNSSLWLALPHCTHTSLSRDEGQGTSQWVKS